MILSETPPSGKTGAGDKQKPYREKKAKGRSISMTDAFYSTVKQFAEANPDLGGISGLTVKALKEYFDRENRQAVARQSEDQAKKLKEYAEWMEKMEKAWRERPA